MENQKNSKGVVALLVILVVALGALCVLFATETISLSNKSNANENSNNGNNTQGNTNSNDVDSALANKLYEILGIVDKNDCLNYFLSSDNYKTNAKKIFGIYASYNNLNTNHYNDGACNEECHKVLSCAECSSIKKTTANKITKLYSLDNLQFNELPGFSDEYAYTNGIPAPICHYGVTHDTIAHYSDSNSITIIDNQVVTDYSYDHQQINSTKNQTVTYDFKKDSDGNYYLSQVSVK